MFSFKDVPKKGTAFLCLSDGHKLLLTLNERKQLENGDFKEPGWGMPGGGVIDWQKWASDDPAINEKINLFKANISQDCELFLEGMLRESFEEGGAFFLNDKEMVVNISKVISSLFKTFDFEKVISLWKEKILLFHEYALAVKELDIFETVLIEPEKLDKKTGKMRGPIHIFKPKPGKVDFSTLNEVSAVNDVAQTVSRSEWWFLEELQEVAFKKSQDVRVGRDRYVYTNHIERLKKIGVVNIANYGR